MATNIPLPPDYDIDRGISNIAQWIPFIGDFFVGQHIVSDPNLSEAEKVNKYTEFLSGQLLDIAGVFNVPGYRLTKGLGARLQKEAADKLAAYKSQLTKKGRKQLYTGRELITTRLPGEPGYRYGQYMDQPGVKAQTVEEINEAIAERKGKSAYHLEGVESGRRTMGEYSTTKDPGRYGTYTQNPYSREQSGIFTREYRGKHTFPRALSDESTFGRVGRYGNTMPSKRRWKY
jgi:hypothetical protein|tara:strand:+ start:1083 stop:1778 length:696 start_codon:yes stop_codon:yes gene_type:complete